MASWPEGEQSTRPRPRQQRRARRPTPSIAHPGRQRALGDSGQRAHWPLRTGARPSLEPGTVWAAGAAASLQAAGLQALLVAPAAGELMQGLHLRRARGAPARSSSPTAWERLPTGVRALHLL